MKNYKFDGTIEKEILENYLSRSATAAFLTDTLTLEDDIRAIQNLGIKFLGRVANIWEPNGDDEGHFEIAKHVADEIHKMDDEIILQACIFEAIYKIIETIPIPAYVFEAFHLPVEKRCFRFEDTLFPEKPKGFIWGDFGGIPDLNRIETRLWFYYRATRYMDAGFEALHMGQIHLYTANDRGFVKTKELFEMIRSYGSQCARRHKVMMDAHTHGINIDGKLLFDYHAMPYTRVPLLEKEGKKLVFVREGFSEGGLNPNDWSADVMPFLMEYDNWGGKVVDDPSIYTREELAWMDWWGYDQIAWYANQDEESRNHILEYTYKWTLINNVNAYFEIPFRRGLDQAAVKMKRADNGEDAVQDYYQMNTRSKLCPLGFNQEEVMKNIWAKGDGLRETAGNPRHLIDFGAKNVFDEETGIKIPEKVVVYGSFQSHVGAVKYDSNSETTRMYYIGDNTYTLSVVMPYRGEFDYAISTYGTLSSTYCYDVYPRSGSSNKAYFKVEKDNSVIRFRYRFIDNIVTVEVI